MKHILSIPFLLIIFSSAFAQKLTIAVASNAQYAIKELAKEYQKKSNIEIDVITGASGKLTNQIMQGAPFHIFFSADMNYPTHLFNKGFSDVKPKVYAYGTLVLWSIKEITLSKDLRALKSESIKRIAIANQELAPYGKQTVNLLKTINLYEEVKDKIIEGESISQVNQYITTGNVDLGFTAKSVVVSPELNGKGKWLEIDSKYYTPIAQGVLLLKRGKEEFGNAAQEFIDFVFSSKGNEILVKNGYKVNLR